MSIRAVVWDIDDTLFDYTGADRAGMRGALAAEGLLARVRHAEQALVRWRAITDAQWARFAAGEVDFQGQRRDRVRAFLGADAERRRGRRLVRAVHRALRGRLGALPGRRCPFWTPSPPATGTRCCPTPASTSRTASCASSGVRDRFEAVLCAAELGVSKPDAGGLPRGLRGAGAAPRTRWRTSATTRRSTGGAPRRPGCCRSGSTGAAGRRAPAPPGAAPDPDPRRTPRAARARIPVLEPRPPSGNVLPAPREAGRKAGTRRRTLEQDPRRGLRSSGLWCNWQHD